MTIEGEATLTCQDCKKVYKGRIRVYHEPYDGHNSWGKNSVRMADDVRGGAIANAREHHRVTPRRDKDGDRDLFSDNPEDAAHNLFTTVVRGLGSLGIAMVNVGLPEASMITVPYKVKGLIDSPELHNY